MYGIRKNQQPDDYVNRDLTETFKNLKCLEGFRMDVEYEIDYYFWKNNVFIIIEQADADEVDEKHLEDFGIRTSHDDGDTFETIQVTGLDKVIKYVEQFCRQYLKNS